MLSKISRKLKHKYNRLRYLTGCGSVGRNITVFGKVYLDSKRNIFLGNNVKLNKNISIYARAPVYLEDSVTISPSSLLVSGQYDTKDWRTDCIRKKKHVEKPIRIGKGTWICANATILPGVEIKGKGCIIGAGSVVNRSFDEDFILIAGNPATRKKSISQ